MIHLTMTDQTVMSVPVKSLSRWHKLTTLGVTISSINTSGLSPIEPKSSAVSVVYLKDGATLYVMEEATTIDALYKAATGLPPMEPLRKVEGETFPRETRMCWLSWSQIEKALDASVREDEVRDSDKNEQGHCQFMDQNALKKNLGFE